MTIDDWALIWALFVALRAGFLGARGGFEEEKGHKNRVLEEYLGHRTDIGQT